MRRVLCVWGQLARSTPQAVWLCGQEAWLERVGHTRRGARAEDDEAAQGRFYPSRWRSRSSLRPPSAPGPPPDPPTPTIHPVEGQM